MTQVIFIRHGDIERNKFGRPNKDKLTKNAVIASTKIEQILNSKGYNAISKAYYDSSIKESPSDNRKRVTQRCFETIKNLNCGKQEFDNKDIPNLLDLLDDNNVYVICYLSESLDKFMKIHETNLKDYLKELSGKDDMDFLYEQMFVLEKNKNGSSYKFKEWIETGTKKNN